MENTSTEQEPLIIDTCDTKLAIAKLRLTIKTKSGRIKTEYTEFNESTKVCTLKETFQREFKTSSHRQRFTFIKPGTDPCHKKNKIALTDNAKTFKDYDLIALNGGNASIELIFKDLGPQISWRTVFLVEYFGPMLMHCLPYMLPSLFYPGAAVKPKCLTQKLAFGMIMLHYFKRELETLFIHRFSAQTMPIWNVFKNSFHYWVLGGISISYFLYHPQYRPPFEDNPATLYGIIGLWAFCELLNLDAHIRLKMLRPPGTKTRGIPKGQLFEYVSCANYFWEISGWFWFSLFTSVGTSWFFYGVGAVQMLFWARTKHKRYIREFKNYPRNRTALIPFIA